MGQSVLGRGAATAPIMMERKQNGTLIGRGRDRTRSPRTLPPPGMYHQLTAVPDTPGHGDRSLSVRPKERNVLRDSLTQGRDWHHYYVSRWDKLRPLAHQNRFLQTKRTSFKQPKSNMEELEAQVWTLIPSQFFPINILCVKGIDTHTHLEKMWLAVQIET